MHLNASPLIFMYADALRKRETEAEKIMWSRLRKKQVEGEKFRRQHPFKKFVGDFYCYKLRLLIEIDGDYHLTPEQIFYDGDRSEILEIDNIQVLRFTNDDVLNSLENVIFQIKTLVQIRQKERILCKKLK